MKVGDLIQHRDDPLRQRGPGIIGGIYVRRGITLADVYWSRNEVHVGGYLLNELRFLDESR